MKVTEALQLAFITLNVYDAKANTQETRVRADQVYIISDLDEVQENKTTPPKGVKNSSKMDQHRENSKTLHFKGSKVSLFSGDIYCTEPKEEIQNKIELAVAKVMTTGGFNT